MRHWEISKQGRLKFFIFEDRALFKSGEIRIYVVFDFNKK